MTAGQLFDSRPAVRQPANPGLAEQGLAKLYTKIWGFEPGMLGQTLVFGYSLYEVIGGLEQGLGYKISSY